jgi:hypothetical protein
LRFTPFTRSRQTGRPITLTSGTNPLGAPIPRSLLNQLRASIQAGAVLTLNYRGTVYSVKGRDPKPIRIERGIIWNLLDGSGNLRGQAAMFSDWTHL